MKASGAVAVIVAVCIIFSVVFAVSVSGGNVSSAEFYSWLRDSGIPEFSVSGTYRANFNTYTRYDLVVYGNPGDVSGNELKQGEYRYLGFTYLEGRYTNLDFPNDETGNLPPEQWDYVTVDGAGESWDLLEQTVQKPYMLHTPLRGHGAFELTGADIGISKAKVQSAASWGSAGSIYTLKSNGYYATFSVPSMGKGTLSASLVPEDSIRYITEADDCIDTGLGLIASVNKPVNEVKFIKVVFNGGNWSAVRFFHSTNNIEISQNAVFDLPEYVPGTIRVDAKVTSESIFGDRLEKNLSCVISIRQGAGSSTPVPSPQPTAPPPAITPNPSVVPIPTSVPTPPPGDDSGWNQNEEDKTPEISIDLSGSWNHWGSDTHRYLALERIYIDISIQGSFEKAVIRLSHQLEAMSYTNELGHTYDYADDFFGHTVEFPADSTVYRKSGSWRKTEFQWEYSLPMCDETIGWDDSRKAEPYTITVMVFNRKGDSFKYIIDDLEVTGNIYELLYPQPLN